MSREKSLFQMLEIKRNFIWNKFQLQYLEKFLTDFKFNARFIISVSRASIFLPNSKLEIAHSDCPIIFRIFFENLSSKMLHVKWIVFSIVLKIHRYRDVKNLKLLFRRTKRLALIFLKQRLKITLRCIKLQ